MSRFSNLEFGNESEGASNAGEFAKDERYYLAEARAAFEIANFEQGLRSYARVLEFNPQNTGAWAGQVRMLIELGEFQEAKLWADKALERFPRDAELLAAKAVALARLGDLKAALAFSDAAFEERGDTPYIWLARGDVLLARKEQRADYCFEKAMAMAPADWFIRWLAARILYFYEKFSLGLKLAQEALNLDAARPNVWLQLGRCQAALGWVGPARQSFEQARSLNPHFTEADMALLALSDAGLGTRIAAYFRQLFSRS
jgi:tetratricopeptide (TPR) repeat protein